MDVKKWAGGKLGGPPAKNPMPAAQAAPGRPPPMAPGHSPPSPQGALTGPRGPVGNAPPLFNPALTSEHLPPDQAQWAQIGGKMPSRPDNPPAWVDDEAAWERAKEAVQKNWDDYEEPWAVVATVYESMSS